MPIPLPAAFRYGEDWIAEHYLGEAGRVQSDDWYSDPCNFGQPSCGTAAVGKPPLIEAEAEPDETLETLAEAVRRLERSRGRS